MPLAAGLHGSNPAAVLNQSVPISSPAPCRGFLLIESIGFVVDCVPLFLRLSVAVLGVLAVAPGALAQADWRPKPEPQTWQQLRVQYLPEPEWQFMDSIRNARVEAAEYIRTPRAVGDTMELEAGLLLKTTGRDGMDEQGCSDACALFRRSSGTTLVGWNLVCIPQSTGYGR